MKKILSLLMSFAVSALFMPYASHQVKAEQNSDVFYDDFSGKSLDSDKWLVAYKNWGGKVTENGVKVDYNGGVIPQNISVKNENLILTGNGNLYNGDLKGINKDGSERSDGKRTGAAIATKEYFASGSYEVRAKISPEFGACSAIWTFEYEEDWDTGKITNHEIDIEMPGRPKSAIKNQNFQYALCNTWIGENDGEYKTGYTDIGVNQADGNFHKYRFDWHTGDENEEARVDFYFDDVLTYTSKEYIPTNEGRLWLGLWFPNAWAGVPNFETSTFEIDYVKITPFHESGDTKQNETYPDDGWGNIEDIATSSVKGDVNADGKFNIADAVIFQKWLLDFPDVKLNDWKAADLCEDGKLNVFDLCLMKQELVLSQNNDFSKKLIGMEYREAVANGYISKSEYNYQISGKLKSSIEKKMNRPLDYSVDRFYLVNSDAFNSDTVQYLYNSATKDVYMINAKTKMNCATWYWKGSKASLYGIDSDIEVQNKFLDAMEFYGITEIYYSIGANKLVNNTDTVATFVKNAYARNMKVYLLTGENTWLYEDTYQTAIYRIFDRVEEYNKSVDADARIAGVSYDAEVWTNSEYNWKNNDSTRYQQIQFIKTAQQYADSKKLSVSYCLPFWITRYNYTDADGTTKNIYDSITQISNNTVLMAYRDSASAVEKLVAQVQNGAEKSAFDYAKANDCNLEIGLQAAQTSEGDYVTFYEEEKENTGYINSVIAEIQSDLSEYQNHTTFAIHHAIPLYEYYENIE